MSTREFDPRQLDVAALAAAGAEIQGAGPVAEFERLATVAQDPTPTERVDWRARGERRVPRGEAPQVWLHLTAGAQLSMQCQRCLQPVEVSLAVEREFLFVHGEETAAALDAESEDDVLALTRSLDLPELVEDELLLALPLVPRHEVCPHPLQVPQDHLPGDEAPNPFAALAALKRPDPLN